MEKGVWILASTNNVNTNIHQFYINNRFVGNNNNNGYKL